jgi:CheY-like chemotaxis protein
MDKINILWADDEIDLLKPHILFLQEKGYHVETTNNGAEAVDLIKQHHYDIVFLDENMPGLSGIETLGQIKNLKSSLPVIMITKSEEEGIMEDAIGSKISDYLIKPVNPKQILLALKKNLENKRLISEKTTSAYQQEFRNIGMTISDRLSFTEWVELYKKMIFWELELEKSNDPGMADILKMQKEEANTSFFKFIQTNYLNWLNKAGENTPVLSHNVFQKMIAPLLDKDKAVFVLLIDNMRLDQWKILQSKFEEYFRLEEEKTYSSILPTATQYARNAFFAGLLPAEIQKRFPQYWVDETAEEGKNNYEKELLEQLLIRLGKRDLKFSYNKITNLNAGKKLAENLSNLMGNKLNVIVYNFVDMLSHSRTDMEVIRELAETDSAYRSLTLSWFEHSPLLDIVKQLAEKNVRLVITTDHGTINVSEPSKVVGDKNTNTNLRYKLGKALQYEKRDVFEVLNPADAHLPKVNVSTTYIFAKNDKFFAYPNNYNYYVSYYKNSFQHGGISLEEMIIPLAVMGPK